MFPVGWHKTSDALLLICVLFQTKTFPFFYNFAFTLMHCMAHIFSPRTVIEFKRQFLVLHCHNKQLIEPKLLHHFL